MSCKKIEQLIKKSLDSKLNESEWLIIKKHMEQCSHCLELYNQDMVLESLFNLSEIDEEYIIPENIMKERVALKLKHSKQKFDIFRFIREPYVISAATLLLFIGVSLSYINITSPSIDNSAYEVNLNGISLEMVEDQNLICDLLESAGLEEASVELIGCEQTCNLIIFDLKNKEEAELVVNIFHAIDKQDISSEVNKVKDFQQQVL